MRITKLRFTNFRNYEDSSIEPGPDMNILIGPNGQGKSALLEAIYLLATSKSHRTARDSELIRLGSDWARISSEVDRQQREEVLLEITLSRTEKKSVRINKVRHAKIGDIIGRLNAVIFSSADLDMVKSEPSNRRRFMNLEISQVSPQYVYAMGRYKRVLEQRNIVLRESRRGLINGKSIEVWDDQLVTYGSIMMEKRLVFLRRLSEIAEPIYEQVSGGREELRLVYEPNVKLDELKKLEDIRSSFKNQLKAARENDLLRRTTTKGPHRDEISMRVSGMDVRAYGSQGQQRSVALAIKLAEISLMEEMVGEPPVALLDDVAAELDETRRAQVFELTLGRCQTFVTTTFAGDLPSEVVRGSDLFEVEKGTVRRA